MKNRKKIAFIIAHKNFRDEELLVPQEILLKSGASVTIASSSINTCIGVLGAKINPGITIDILNPDNYDAIIFVGGGGSREYFEDITAHKIIIKAIQSNKILGAICIAPSILAHAGVLKNKKATVFKSEIESIKNFGAIYIDDNVVIDENIITARGPEAAKEFGEAIVNKLNS